jgi:hypothetical protein
MLADKKTGDTKMTKLSISYDISAIYQINVVTKNHNIKTQ